MRKLKIYIDTSVIGGYFDPEFADELNNPEQTLPLLRSKVGQFAGIISERKKIL